MIKIKKVYNLKIISVVTVSIFLLNSTVYSIGLSNKICLRVPSGSQGLYERMSETIGKDWPAIEQKFRILIDKAKSEGELKKLYRTIVMEVHPDRNPAYIIESTETFKNLSNYFQDRLAKGFNIRPPTDNSDWLADWAAGKSFSAIDRDGIEFGRFVIEIGASSTRKIKAPFDKEVTENLSGTFSSKVDIEGIPGIRTIDNDVFGIERESYLEHLNVGILPDSLKEKALSYTWPIDMSDPNVHIVNSYGELDLLGKNKKEHFAIDVQVKPGTEVHPVEDGFVVFAERYDDPGRPIDSKAHSFANIWVYSPTSNLLWLYVHLDKDSVPSRLLTHHWFDGYETEPKFKVTREDVIGKVNKWHTDNVLKDIDLPESVEKVYGRSYDHLHLEVRYVNDLYNGFGVGHLMPVNPLQLMRPLYSLSQMDFSSRAPQTSL